MSQCKKEQVETATLYCLLERGHEGACRFESVLLKGDHLFTPEEVREAIGWVLADLKRPEWGTALADVVALRLKASRG